MVGGDGGGVLGGTASWPLWLGGSCGGVVAANFGGDVHVDVTVACDSGAGVLLNNGTGGFSRWNGNGALASVMQSRGVALCDMNRDAVLEVYVAASPFDVIYLGYNPTLWISAAGIAVMSPLLTSSSASVACVDINGDGVSEVLQRSVNASVAPHRLFSQATVASYWMPVAGDAIVPFLSAPTAASVFAVDVDGDGDLDVPSIGFVNGLPLQSRERSVTRVVAVSTASSCAFVHSAMQRRASHRSRCAASWAARAQTPPSPRRTTCGCSSRTRRRHTTWTCASSAAAATTRRRSRCCAALCPRRGSVPWVCRRCWCETCRRW
jgi:hypothetical protein